MLAVTFTGYWFALPIVRGWMLPEAGGASGILWVIGPAHVLVFGASAVLSSLTLPFVIRPLALHWQALDQQQNAPPLAANKGHLVQGLLLFAVYAFCGVAYFASHGEVRDASIAFTSILGTRTYDYAQIRRLEHQPPAGGQVDRYAIELDDGSWGYFDADCDELDAASTLAVADFVSRRSGLPWVQGTR